MEEGDSKGQDRTGVRGTGPAELCPTLAAPVPQAFTL